MAPTYTEADLELALADLAKQDTPNYSAASKKYGVPRRTLSNCRSAHVRLGSIDAVKSDLLDELQLLTI